MSLVRCEMLKGWITCLVVMLMVLIAYCSCRVQGMDGSTDSEDVEHLSPLMLLLLE